MTGTPRSYAECLMKLAELRTAGETLAAPAVLIASDLRARVTRIMSRRLAIAPRWSHGIATGNAFALFALSFGLAALPLVEATALALPRESAEIVDTAIGRAALPTPELPRVPDRREARSGAPGGGTGDPAPRKAARIPAPRPARQVPSSETAAAPRADIVPAVPLPGPSNDSANIGPVLYRADTSSPEPAVAHELAQTPAPAVEPVKTPWAAVADGSTALGKKSKDAGLATAGAFTRFARRFAGSF
jgi:hypothetical protein